MTYSDCWIDTTDDEAFKALTRERSGVEAGRAERIHVLPPHPRPGEYWINAVKEWAGREGLPLEYRDPLEVQVPVRKAALLQFLDDVFGSSNRVSRLRAHIREHCRENRTYLIVADEF